MNTKNNLHILKANSFLRVISYGHIKITIILIKLIKTTERSSMRNTNNRNNNILEQIPFLNIYLNEMNLSKYMLTHIIPISNNIKFVILFLLSCLPFLHGYVVHVACQHNNNNNYHHDFEMLYDCLNSEIYLILVQSQTLSSDPPLQFAY